MAAIVPMDPPMPKSLSGLAGTRTKLRKPKNVVAMHQNDGVKVLLTAFMASSLPLDPVSWAILFQLEVKNIICD